MYKGSDNVIMKQVEQALAAIVFSWLISCSSDTIKSVDDETQTVSLDCGAGACTELVVPDDPYQSNPDFYGYADPSMRKDPHSPTIWLAYSYPHYKLAGDIYVPSVEIHLAKSEDSGDHWTFEGSLFEPIAMNNPVDGMTEGFLDHETINLLPMHQNGWVAVRLNYFIPKNGGFQERPNNSFHISIITADSPRELKSGNVGTIGGSFTHPNWEVDQKLIPDDLISEVFFWNEPALYFDSVIEKLYLVMVAFVYKESVPDMSKNDVYVFSTTPSGSPKTWHWGYNGKLVDAAIANELGGERISQTDIAKGEDGKLLLVCTPDDWNSIEEDFNHKGCKIVEIKSLDNPELERDIKGVLKVRTHIIASDANGLGSGASTYDSHSTTGVLFTKRVKTTHPPQLIVSTHKTGIKP